MSPVVSGELRRYPGWASLDAEARGRAATAAIARAKVLDPQLHAFVELESAVREVRAGTLAGLPYAAKDIFATNGRLPTCGLAHGIDLGIAGDAEVLRRLDRAGAVRIGFCTMTELAYEPSGFNSRQVRARNPWNPDFITGGSSSGSAVAVASGIAVTALGSDTGGSVRIPAQACGVTAWKPTAGRVFAEGAMALAPTLDTIGLLARGAADLAAPAAVMLDDAANVPPVRRAVVLADILDSADAAVRNACSAGIGAIEAAGVALSRRNAAPAIATADAHALVVMQGEAARAHRARLDDPLVDPTLRKRLAKGLTIDDATLSASRTARPALVDDFLGQVFGAADAVLLPVMPIRTPRCAVCDPASPVFDARTLYRLSEWTRFVNMLGLPAVAIPVGFDERGMPLAMQIVGRPDADRALIALAEAVQMRSDWHGRVPSGLSDA